MMGHKVCSYGEIWLIIPKLSLLPFLSGALGLHIKFCNNSEIKIRRGNRNNQETYFSFLNLNIFCDLGLSCF